NMITTEKDQTRQKNHKIEETPSHYEKKSELVSRAVNSYYFAVTNPCIQRVVMCSSFLIRPSVLEDPGNSSSCPFGE
ncbi:MAG TPA: hypothetical protein VK553_03765, partial [Candidatus Nitrosopolaris rasttigaisensis]|nr:hypothetical protein [Candidatus Nitrosopolaris rasttigaisensis]